MYKLGVVVLNFGIPEDTLKTVSQLKSLNSNINIVVVDNYSDEANKLELKESLKNVFNEQDKLILLNSNYGYSYGNNAGLRHLFEKNSCSHALVLNPDIEIKEFLLKIDQLNTKEPILFSGVITENGSNYSRLKFNPWNFLSKKISRQTNFKYPIYISGCCFGMNKEMWQRFGGFNENFFLYFEELDFIYRFKKKFQKFPKIVTIDSIKINHFVGGVTGASKSKVISSPFSDYWSCYSRITFCIKNIPTFLFSALIYNVLKLLLRLVTLKFSNAFMILKATLRL